MWSRQTLIRNVKFRWTEKRRRAGSGGDQFLSDGVYAVASALIPSAVHAKTTMIHSGRHFLQIPGPTNVPDRILRAMDRAVIDHRGPEFAKLGCEVLEGLCPVFQT